MQSKRYIVKFSEEELQILNKIRSEKKRKKAMSIFQYIIKHTEENKEFLSVSLDELFKKYRRYNKLSLTYFKQLAELLVELKLLRIKRVGKLKFYGKNLVKICIKKEEERKKRLKKTNIKTIIKYAKKIMKESNIKENSIVFNQVLESLNYILKKKTIHSDGMIKYIEKVILDKVDKQKIFKDRLVDRRKKQVHNRRKNQRYNETYRKLNKEYRFVDFTQRERTNKEWRELEERLLGWI